MPFLTGSLLEDLTPAINPLKEVDDPEDKMPDNWDEREQWALPLSFFSKYTRLFPPLISQLLKMPSCVMLF